MTHARNNLNRRLRILVLIAAALTLPGMASGEDIDLYTGTPINGGQPNVIVLLDSSSAWNGAANFTCPPPYASVVSSINAGKDAGFEQCALYSAVTALGTNPQLAGNINLGFMRWDQNSSGGYFKYPQPQPALLPVIGDAQGSTTTTGSTNLSNLQTIIQGLNRQSNGGDGSNNPNTGGGMQEVWAYYARKIGLSTTDYSTLAKLNACQKNFVIYIANAMGNGDPNQSQNIWGPALVAAGATAAQQQTVVIPPPYNKYQGKGGGPEWARFMYQTDLSGGANAGSPQNIITYTIAVTDGKNPDYVSYVQSMAANGGGKSFVININDPNALNDLVKDLLTVFNEVQATNSVFASVSLPVSVNAQGTSLNQVYVGMFRPDATAAPRWAGNLKQYQLGYDSSGNVVLDDSLGNPAISNAGTGFISPTALSFWTADHQTGTPRDGPFTVTASGYTSTIVTSWPANGFWINHPTSAGGAFDAPDGEIVDKGGVAEMSRADYLTDQSKRVIYTCNSVGGCPTSGTMPSFDTSNTALTTTALQLPSGSTATDASNLVNWVRGTDNNTGTGAESPAGPGAPVTVRPSIHGDVLHSRPAVVNYGGSVGIVVFYGSNDGLFRAVNGNTGVASTATTPPPTVITMADNRVVRPGGELWSFIAPDFFGKFQRLRNNSPALTLGATTGSGKDYFFDGTTTVYQDLRVAGSPKTYIYLTARRGGRLIYAFDVSDPTKPPVFLWSKTNANIPELGQTWSQPKLALVKGHTDINGNPIPVVIMGGGYDPAEDIDPVGAADTMGRAIVVLDAYNGNTVWTACPSGCTTSVPAMTYAIPADITLLDRNGDGYTDRLYAADLGGNIWRVDVDDASTANWTVTKIASLGGTGTSARKFFYPPDVTPTPAFDAVVAASGDREHPLLSNASSSVVNRFYMLKDTNTGTSVASGWTTITESMLTDETGAAAGTTPPYSSTSTSSGFYVTLSHAGEKAVNAPLTVAGYTYFGTNTPADPTSNPNMCYPNLGIARGYAINFLTGAGLNSNGYIVFDGGGLPPSPVFGLVAVDPSTPNVYTPVLIGGGNQTGTGGGNNSSALGAQKVTPPNTGKRKRTYWFTEGLQ
ncbi:MAG TPA: PilC/PilY family type IV pilus protein [Rhodanobacter sp.]|nr:PilC/PilY family type IV pilus protein [Rhodanobacter sp.]